MVGKHKRDRSKHSSYVKGLKVHVFATIEHKENSRPKPPVWKVASNIICKLPVFRHSSNGSGGRDHHDRCLLITAFKSTKEQMELS